MCFFSFSPLPLSLCYHLFKAMSFTFLCRQTLGKFVLEKNERFSNKMSMFCWMDRSLQSRGLIGGREKTSGAVFVVLVQVACTEKIIICKWRNFSDARKKMKRNGQSRQGSCSEKKRLSCHVFSHVSIQFSESGMGVLAWPTTPQAKPTLSGGRVGRRRPQKCDSVTPRRRRGVGGDLRPS